MELLKLVSEDGWWAYYDKSQRYHYVVHLLEEKDVYRYHLVDDDWNEIYKPTIKDVIHETFGI